MQWSTALWVGVGGFFGAGLRYVVAEAAQRSSPLERFPVGTLVVNVLGCVGIGFLVAVLDARATSHPALRPALIAGFLGGFTTYSAFAHESLTLLRDGSVAHAVLHGALHLVLGLVAVGVGFWLGKSV